MLRQRVLSAILREDFAFVLAEFCKVLVGSLLLPTCLFADGSPTIRHMEWFPYVGLT